MQQSGPLLSRRHFLTAAGAAAVTVALPIHPARTAQAIREFRLMAQSGRIPLLGPGYSETAVWCYGDGVPGPEIRARQGERIRIVVQNRLEQTTTVHWHGLRVPNAMDGVPHLTQPPIKVGSDFTYEFELRDAGTYLYHSHDHGNVQVPMGLFGPLIVEEPEPIPVDRDLTWMLSDWRLTRDAQISSDFGNFMDMSMAGRIGNTVTINARMPGSWSVRAGERIRLRIINTASARLFALSFDDHRPRVIALDGQPVEPHEPEQRLVILGPGMRADLVIDMTGDPGGSYAIRDSFYTGQSYKLAEFTYSEDKPLRSRPPEAAIKLPTNTMPEPDPDKAERHTVAFGGGMMGMMGGRGMGGMGGMMGGMRGRGGMWTINGVAATGPAMEPFLMLDRGRSYILSLRNDTAWFHPIHLHGHSFRVIARNGASTRNREWRDTVLIAPRESADIAFVADNPGDWMIHCHILDHQEGGMMGVIRVA